jgi:hypothetical protein
MSGNTTTMTGLEKTVLFFMISFAVYLLVQPIWFHWGQRLKTQVCLHKEKWGNFFYLNSFVTKKGELTYSFSGSLGGDFWRRIQPRHMKLLIEKIKLVRDDIETGAYSVCKPYETVLGDNSRGKLYFGKKFTVFKRYGFISYLSENNEQKYHNDLFDIFICDSPDGHFAVFKPLGDPETPRLIHFSLQDMKKTCEKILEAFEKDVGAS